MNAIDLGVEFGANIYLKSALEAKPNEPRGDICTQRGHKLQDCQNMLVSPLKF